jgi:hypothetical protein
MSPVEVTVIGRVTAGTGNLDDDGAFIVMIACVREAYQALFGIEPVERDCPFLLHSLK